MLRHMTDQELIECIEKPHAGTDTKVSVTKIGTEYLGVLEDGAVVSERTVYVSVQPVRTVEFITLKGTLRCT